MTHPFHPLCGQDFEFVAYRQNWGERRVHLHDENGDLFSLNWLFSGNGVESARERSCLLQKLSRIRANLLRCPAAQVTIGSLREGAWQEGSPSWRAMRW